MANISLYKTLLTCIQQVIKESDGVPFNQDLFEKLKDKTEPLSSFFSISTQEAIVLAFLVNAALKENEVNLELLINQFGSDISSIADVQEIILALKEQSLAYTRGGGRRSSRLAFKHVYANPKVLAAITEGDIGVLEFKPAERINDFLRDVTELIIQRVNEIIDTEKLINEVNRLVKLNLNIPEVNWLYHQQDLKGADLVIFLNIAIEHSMGEDEVSIDKMIREVFDDVFQRTNYKQSFKSRQSKLQSSGLVVPSGDYFSVFNMVQLSEQAMTKLFGNMKEVCIKPFSPKMGVLIDCSQIPDEKLYFNQKEKDQISTLQHAMQIDSYSRILEKMLSNHMRPGFTVLMYGHPGTGKTSSVKNIARKTGRNIYMVDIPKIHSKWVGESEKNLSKIFEEYKLARKQFENDPILLFNEADALLGKRFSVSNSVDKMNNSMQNILLQELEDFEGIFIATTNLADHLDDAFDRRFLYKIEFKKPEEHVRKEILINSFPHVTATLLDSINREYDLTGGQIANIRKKILVKGMLDEGFDLEYELNRLCAEENMLKKGYKANRIGFTIPNQA